MEPRISYFFHVFQLLRQLGLVAVWVDGKQHLDSKLLSEFAANILL